MPTSSMNRAWVISLHDGRGVTTGGRTALTSITARAVAAFVELATGGPQPVVALKPRIQPGQHDEARQPEHQTPTTDAARWPCLPTVS